MLFCVGVKGYLCGFFILEGIKFSLLSNLSFELLKLALFELDVGHRLVRILLFNVLLSAKNSSVDFLLRSLTVVGHLCSFY